MSEKLKGNVKWFNDAKGFGFIENGTGDVFVHYSVIESTGFKTLKDGEEVEYELEQGEKGLHAKNVIRLNVSAEELNAKPIKNSKGLAGKIEVIPAHEIEAPIEQDQSQRVSVALKGSAN